MCEISWQTFRHSTHITPNYLPTHLYRIFLLLTFVVCTVSVYLFLCSYLYSVLSCFYYIYLYGLFYNYLYSYYIQLFSCKSD